MRANFKKMMAVGLLAASAAGAFAQAYPSRPITLISPFAPGGAVDGMARIVAEELAKDLGQPVVVENVPGASGVIGSTRVARAAADGYVLLANNMSHAAVNAVYDKAPFDAVKDFTPLGIAGYLPMLVVVRNDLPGGDPAGMLAWIRANHASASIANNGPGSATQLCGRLFTDRIGATGIQEVPYKGTGPALLDVSASRVDMSCDSEIGSGPMIRAGRLKALAVTSTQRVATLPDVPTFAELGVKDLDVTVWVGIFGPRNLPADVTQRLSRAMQKLATQRDYTDRLNKLGAAAETPERSGSVELGRRMTLESGRWSQLLSPSTQK